jgi:hypothetical protein
VVICEDGGLSCRVLYCFIQRIMQTISQINKNSSIVLGLDVALPWQQQFLALALQLQSFALISRPWFLLTTLASYQANLLITNRRVSAFMVWHCTLSHSVQQFDSFGSTNSFELGVEMNFD